MCATKDKRKTRIVQGEREKIAIKRKRNRKVSKSSSHKQHAATNFHLSLSVTVHQSMRQRTWDGNSSQKYRPQTTCLRSSRTGESWSIVERFDEINKRPIALLECRTCDFYCLFRERLKPTRQFWFGRLSYFVLCTYWSSLVLIDMVSSFDFLCTC